MLLQGLCVYNYNHICEVLQIKTMTERYDDRSPQTILLKTMYLKKSQLNVTVLMFSPTDEKTPYGQGQFRTVVQFSR